MVSKKYWKHSIQEFIHLVHQESQSKEISILGTNFEVIPGVFSPIYSSDTKWFAEKIVPLVREKSFLEIGAGTGVISCLASLNGATKVTATDINPAAIMNIQSNAKSHHLNIEIKEGSLFSPIEKNSSFDLIFWNHPFYYDENDHELDMVSSSVIDNKYKYLEEFFSKSKNYLNKNGILLLGTSNIARINLIKKFAIDNSFSMSLLEKKEVPVYQGKRIKMDLRVYSFRRQEESDLGSGIS